MTVAETLAAAAVQTVRMSPLFLLLLLAVGPGLGLRRERSLAFRKGSTFFYRLNYKANALPYTSLFAQASGFKVAWELPVRKGRAASVAESQEGARLLFESHGFDGGACLLKSLCQAAEYVERTDGVLGKILALLSGLYPGNGTSALEPLVCRGSADRCPLHFVGFNAFSEPPT